METIAHTQRNFTAIAVAGLLGLTTLLLAPAAQATRLPADPVPTFVGTPIELSRLVNDSHAANVWAMLEDLRAGR